MSDTPETDAKVSRHIGFYSCATVPAELCRKLERERDEAREELHDIRLNLGADAEGYTLLHAVCVLQQERDEARTGRQAYKRLAVKHAQEREQAREIAGRLAHFLERPAYSVDEAIARMEALNSYKKQKSQ